MHSAVDDLSNSNPFPAIPRLHLAGGDEDILGGNAEPEEPVFSPLVPGFR